MLWETLRKRPQVSRELRRGTGVTGKNWKVPWGFTGCQAAALGLCSEATGLSDGTRMTKKAYQQYEPRRS